MLDIPTGITKAVCTLLALTLTNRIGRSKNRHMFDLFSNKTRRRDDAPGGDGWNYGVKVSLKWFHASWLWDVQRALSLSLPVLGCVKTVFWFMYWAIYTLCIFSIVFQPVTITLITFAKRLRGVVYYWLSQMEFLVIYSDVQLSLYYLKHNADGNILSNYMLAKTSFGVNNIKTTFKDVKYYARQK